MHTLFKLLIILVSALTLARSSVAVDGPLRVSANGRYLVEAGGTPFFWLFDTGWRIVTISPADVDLYLSTRAGQGFNGIQIICASTVTLDYVGRAPFTGGNTDTPNESYWTNLDQIISKANNYNLYVAMVPLWGSAYNNLFGTDSAKAARFGKWLGTRYRSRKNVVWITTGEYDSINGYKLPITAAQKTMLNALAQGLDDGHGNSHLMTIHPAAPYTSSLDFHTQSWLDFNMLQSGHDANREAYNLLENHTLIRNDYNKTPPKPVLDGEPFYEDIPDGIFRYSDATNRPRGGADVVRRKAYWATLAGASGHTYGHNEVWMFFTPAFPGQTLWRPAGSGQHVAWKEVLHAPGAVQMKHLKALISSRDLLSRVPDQTLVVDTFSGNDKIIAGRGLDYAFIYTPTGKNFTVRMGKISGAAVRARWYSPRDGTYQDTGLAGSYANTANSTQTFDPPGSPALGNDWVLVLDTAATTPLPPTGLSLDS